MNEEQTLLEAFLDDVGFFLSSLNSQWVELEAGKKDNPEAWDEFGDTVISLFRTFDRAALAKAIERNNGTILVEGYSS
jgi:hypothetical protein